MGKKALIVGINYPGTGHDLRGCVNDALAMRDLLQKKFGFKNITLLTDSQATKRNMLSSLEKLVEGAKDGDILFFHYSGHGSQYTDNKDADHEPDGLDEILIPIDLDWRNQVFIRDDDLKAIFDKVPAGVNLTVVLDCCNSGGGLDQVNQYQPIVENKTSSSGGVTITIGGGKGRFLPPPSVVMEQAEARHLVLKTERGVQHKDVQQTGLLISGCRSHQTSADARFGDQYFGACTYLLLKTLAENDHKVDYKTLAEQLNQKMVKHGFSQRPELNGSQSLFGYDFLASMSLKQPEGDGDAQEGDPTIPNQNDQNQNAPSVGNDENPANVHGAGSAHTGAAANGDGSTTADSSGGKPDSSHGEEDNDKKDKKKKLLPILIGVGIAIAVGIAIFLSQ